MGSFVFAVIAGNSTGRRKIYRMLSGLGRAWSPPLGEVSVLKSATFNTAWLWGAGSCLISVLTSVLKSVS